MLGAEQYVDDYLNAYSGKARPRYSRMLEQIRSGRRDAVIVWHVDRLTRRPIEPEEFAQARRGLADAKRVWGAAKHRRHGWNG